MKGLCCMFGKVNIPPDEVGNNLVVVEDYGDNCNGHFLHTWDDGHRMLMRCGLCGRYVLCQISEFHGKDDAYYVDYFPLESREQADEFNEKYNGFQIEEVFDKPWVAVTNMHAFWKNKNGLDDELKNR